MLKTAIYFCPLILVLLLIALVPISGENSHGTTEQLLQFTSASHVLGFDSHGVIIASRDHMLKVEFLGTAGKAPQVDATSEKGGVSSPLTKVSYRNLWEGVTLVYEAAPNAIFRSSYYLEPQENGVPVDKIRLNYNRPVSIDEGGNLVITYGTGTMVESAPIAWQEVEGKRVPVAAAFIIKGKNEVGFKVGDHIPTTPVVIDPDLTWNTFLGGSGDDYSFAIATDGTYIYVAGCSNATWQESPVRDYSGGWDAFAARLDGNGSLIWNTFLGGSGYDRGFAIATDGTSVYVAGYSGATWQESPVRDYSGSSDAFAAKLGSSGNLIWHTFLGGSGDDEGHGIATDGTYIYVAGCSNGTWLERPVRSHQGDWDAFAAKLDGNGNLAWHTFLGGSGGDYGQAIATDGTYIYVAGYSNAAWGSPVRDYTSGWDAFAAKLGSNGNLAWNTFLGGSGNDEGRAIATDGTSVYVAGESDATWRGTSLPKRGYSGGWDAFAARISEGQPLDVPRVAGRYSTTCSIKLYDWRCNKYEPITGGTLYITYQMGHKVRGYWQPDVVPEGWPTLVPVSGYVGSFYRVDGKVKNTPRISLLFEVGDYCRYPSSPYVTYVLNAKVKWDRKLDTVKSIKGTIYGWGEWGDELEDNSPTMGQFEGKFTAVPAP